jgi:3-deoxy-7-phosphoheptulonate synthase
LFCAFAFVNRHFEHIGETAKQAVFLFHQIFGVIMNVLKPTRAESIQINGQRQAVAENMALAGTPAAKRLATPGACSADLNRMPNGELGMVNHGKKLAAIGSAASNSLVVVRYVAEKPRTNTGFTGIIHEPGGTAAYLEGARQLHQAGVPFASEVMSDAGAELVVPHLTMGWVGAREVSATGPRYAVRPTNLDRDQGVRPLPVWVKNDQDGDLTHTVNALHTIMSEKPQPRTRMGVDGFQELVTYGNPHVGVILRGQDARPDGPIGEIMAEELGTAREKLDSEFGPNRIPIMVDVSHAHAKYEGGGEAGQLAVANSLGGLAYDGWMAETYIHSGKQGSEGLVAGLSLTDACIGEQHVETLLMEMDGTLEGELAMLVANQEVIRV